MALGKTPHGRKPTETISFLVAILTYVNFATLILWGHICELCSRLIGRRSWGTPPVIKGYAPLTDDWEAFYTRNVYRPIRDCWDRPICSAPNTWVDLMERRSNDYHRTFMVEHKVAQRALNFGSYNYLGLGGYHESITESVIDTMDTFSVGTASSRWGLGTTTLHRDLEKMVARFVRKPAAIVYGMGFATNSFTIPSLVGPGCLVVSDSLNHASIVVGARGSGAKIVVFKHNDPADLERVLRKAASLGQARTYRPWRKILIIVEGVYSMEGEICCLKEIVELKKKYKAYLYLDEAHSIGAMGRTGRGIVEHLGISPADVDVMMGTFTKSFSSVGGYIAASQDVIDHIRSVSIGENTSTAISPPCAMQVLQSLRLIMGEDGTDYGSRILTRLQENATFFRRELEMMGLDVLGDEGSPVIPIMLYMPAKIREFSVQCLKRNVAVVVVGFPATPITLSRARFCVSAAHTREDLEMALEVIREVADLLLLRYHTRDGLQRVSS